LIIKFLPIYRFLISLTYSFTIIITFSVFNSITLTIAFIALIFKIIY